ncbi:MAG: hypothetical protein OEY23_15890 [Acidimicrobiia bacterium]|nr:hypothetical protein [Acidimicrobiia bacterium]
MPTIDLLTLANHAEAANGLLYLTGAGWDTITRNYAAGSTPQPHHFGIGLNVVVDWHETNQPWKLELWIEDEDGVNRLLAVDANLEVGRPVGRPPGSSTRAVMAIAANVSFPAPGGYRVVAELAEQQRTYSFRVVDKVG